MEFPPPELPSWDRAQARQSHPDLPSTSILEPAITTMLRKSHSHNQHHHRHHHHIHPHLPHRHHRQKEKEKDKDKDGSSGLNAVPSGIASEGGNSRGGGRVRASSSAAAAGGGRRASMENGQPGATNAQRRGSSTAERNKHLRRRWMSQDHEDGEVNLARLQEERHLNEAYCIPL